MNKEMKKRKKRFWAMCLAAVLMLCSMEPLVVEAASYIEKVNDYDAPIAMGDYIYPGDVFYVQPYSYGESVATCTITYYDVNNTEICSQNIGALGVTENIDGTDYYKGVVPGYTEAGGTRIDSRLFIRWKVISVIVSAGSTSQFALQAQAGVERNITYHLDGGSNNSANPATYVEGGAGAELLQASKENYIFDGWYTSSDFADGTQVTSISASQTGDLTLYAKFTPVDYSISYELNGGTNGAGNPASYTYGTGVSSFADASKANHTFNGWYTTSDFAAGTQVTSISATQGGNVTLYAKFTAAQSSSANNSSANNSSANNSSANNSSANNDNGAGGQSDSGNITTFNMYSMEGGGGEGGTWVYGSSEGLTVRGKGEFWKFTGVKIDGNLIDKSNYSAREGSTIVTLSPEYLNTLGAGMHTLEMQWTDGLGETSFTIVATKTSPKTGDDVSGISLSILTFALGSGMIAVWKRRTKTHIV